MSADMETVLHFSPWWVGREEGMYIDRAQVYSHLSQSHHWFDRDRVADSELLAIHRELHAFGTTDARSEKGEEGE